MEFIETFWGEKEPLNTLQTVCRSVVIFFIALVILRVSGRRSFGVGTPLDNIVVILVGAILSRAIIGASPFVPVVAAASTIGVLHRLFSWLKVRSTMLAKITEGEKILLYKDDHFIEGNMLRALVEKEDVLQALREKGLPNMINVKYIFMERNGTITIVQKSPAGFAS